MVKPLVLGAEAARRTIALASRAPYADVWMARGAAQIGRWSAPPAAARITGRQPRLAGLQEKISAELLKANPAGLDALVDQLEVDTIGNADTLEHLAARLTRVRRYETALAMRRRAAQLEPEQPHRHAALYSALLRAGGEGVINDPVAGLAPGPQVRHAEARAALDRAEELAPGAPYLAHLRGTFEFDHGDADLGLQLMHQAAEAGPTARKWLDLAAAYRKPHILQTDKAFDAYDQALRLNPSSPTAVRGLIITGCRGAQDWQRIWDGARRYEDARWRNRRARAQLLDRVTPLFTGRATADAVRETLVGLAVSHARGIRLSWPVTSLIVYRLHFAGRFSHGFELRRGLAQRTLDWLGTTSAGHSRHRQKVLGALVYLQRYEEAQALIDPMPWEPADRLERLRLEKMAADVHMVQGRAEPYIAYSQRRRQEIPMPGDQQMDQLVRGKRVAVVGPADTGDRLGEIIDSYDVVLRPRHTPEAVAEQADRLGSRTDIAYFSSRDLAGFMDAAAASVETGELKLAVGRGMSAQALKDDVPDWLRFYRYDFSIAYHGALLGISRIVYDVLQFAPAEVSLFNIDFYTGQTTFGAGYRGAEDQGFGPNSVMNEIIIAHDLLFDFRLLQAMMSTGIVTAQGVAAEVLGFSEQQYLHRLDASPALGAIAG